MRYLFSPSFLRGESGVSTEDGSRVGGSEGGAAGDDCGWIMTAWPIAWHEYGVILAGLAASWGGMYRSLMSIEDLLVVPVSCGLAVKLSQ